MAQLLVRNLDEDLIRALKKRAAENGVSAEEEHRRILRNVLSEDAIALNKAFMAHLLTEEGRVDEDLILPSRKTSRHRRVVF